MKTLGIVVGIVLLLGLGALLFLYSGLYNIAASAPHIAPVRWAIVTLKQHSVRAQAADIVVPALDDPAQIRRGLLLYQGYCLVCHGAPGVAPSQIGLGILPTPPPLASRVREWTSAELYWVTRHGLKLAGMPGFGLKLTDVDLWALVAFMEQLSVISPQQYHTMVQAAEDKQYGGLPDRTAPGHPASRLAQGQAGTRPERQEVHP